MARTKDFDPAAALECAAQSFKRHGYFGVSMDTLTDDMGIGRGSLYATYGDKHTLFVSALEAYAEMMVENIAGRLDRAEDPLLEIRTMVRDVARFAATPEGQHGCLLTNSAAELATLDTEVQRSLANGFGRIEDGFYRALRRAQHAGQLGPDKNARALARFFLSTLQGLRVLGKARPDEGLLRDVANSALLCLE